MSIIVLLGATVTTGIYDNNSIPQCCPRIDCARRERNWGLGARTGCWLTLP